jgi:hypothetical protein
MFPLLRRFASLLAVALSAGIAAVPAHAILINGEGPDNVTGIYDRFMLGTYPGAPVANPTFIGAGLDLSGIGWVSANPRQSITLVSSQYFVGATHLMPGAGTMLQFLGTDHLLYSATVGATYAARLSPREPRPGNLPLSGIHALVMVRRRA